jgi:hypothetical protein
MHVEWLPHDWTRWIDRLAQLDCGRRMTPGQVYARRRMMTMDSDRYVTKTMMRNEKRTQQQTNGEHACVALGSALHLHLIFLSLCL